MSIELRQAAEQVLEAFETFGEADDFASLFALTQKMNALRDTLSQQPDNHACKSVQKRLEAKQPASKEHLFEFWWEAHMPNANQENAWSAFTAAIASNRVGISAQQPATPEPVVKASDVMMIRRLMNSGKLTPDTDEGWAEALKVFNHPAPSVPADVVRDAERWRWVAGHVAASNARGPESWAFHYEMLPKPLDNPLKGSTSQHFANAIDAAMLATKGAK